ncbi:hypothetical protein ACHAWF_001281, partial [Thalassiosira exigua]
MDAKSSFPLRSDTNCRLEQFENELVDSKPTSQHDRPAAARGLLLAGSKNAYSLAHSMLGTSSLLVGFYQTSDVLLHSFSQPVQSSDTVAAGAIHVAAGLFGARRLQLGNEKEVARNAMFWPIPIQNLWLTSAALTEWDQGSSALFSMFDDRFVGFTALNLLLTAWQLNEVRTKSGKEATQDTIWLDDSAQNAFLVESVYLFWMQIQMVALLYVSTSVDHPAFLDFMDRFPDMHHLLSNATVNTASFNNVVAFVATLVRYKILSKPSSIDNFVVFSVPMLVSLFMTSRVLSCFFEADD